MSRMTYIIFALLFLFNSEVLAQKNTSDREKSVASESDAKDTLLATVTNNGSGRRKGGGRTAYLALKDLKDSDTLKFNVASGNFGYVTIHGRTSRGSWSVLYRGEIRPMTVREILKSQRSRYTHLVVQVNGEHERYQRRACELNIFKVNAAPSSAVANKTADKTADKAADKKKSTPDGKQTNTAEVILGTAVNDGSGRRKTGGSTANLALTDLKDSDTLKFNVASGNFGYLTIHGRTSRGYWSVLYRGPIRPLKVAQILKGQRSRYTHLIVQVNGEHERYQRRTCKLEILTDKPVAPTASTPVTTEPSNTAPKAIVPPLDVVAASNASMPTVSIKASTEFNTGANDGVRNYVDLKLYFKPNGIVTAATGSTEKPVTFRDANGNTIPAPTQQEVQNGSWTLTDAEGNEVVIARMPHF